MPIIEFLNTMAVSNTLDTEYNEAMMKSKGFEEAVINILTHKF